MSHYVTPTSWKVASSRKGPRIVTRVLCLALLIVSLLVTATPRLPAADLEDTSLGLVPVDVAFYGALLNNKAQFEAFVNSKAYRRIQQMPFVQLGLVQLRSMWNDPNNEELAEVKEFLDEPENKELIELAKSAFAHEIFFYGDMEYARQLSLIQDVTAAIREVQFQNINNEQDLERKIAKRLLKMLDEREDDIRLPDTVLGFKIDDEEAANRQIDRLEQLAVQALEDRPQLRDRLRRESIKDSEFLTWDLDGSLLPWEEVDEEDFEGLTPAERDRLINFIKKQKVRLAIGVYKGYLLLSVGDTNEHLEQLGGNEALASHPQLAPLREHADKTLTSIGFANERFLVEAGSVDRQFNDLVQMIKTGAAETDLSDEVQKELLADLRGLSAKLKEQVPEPGTTLSFTFLVDSGYEGYSYNYGENPQLDFSKPLTILKQMGGKPILFAAGRAKYSPKDYGLLSEIFDRAIYYGEQFAFLEMTEEDRATYEKFKADVQPLLKRLDRVSREKFFPSFRDGQMAFVLDAKLSTGQIHMAAPTPRNALPLPEVAIVAGISDGKALKESVQAYFEIAQEMLDVLRKYDEKDEIPDFKIPKPEQRPGVEGVIYYYPLPPHLGVDDQLAPAAGLSDAFLTLALAPKTAERLLAAEPLQVEGVLADPDQPLGAASYFNFAGFLDMLEPWIEYSIDLVRVQTFGGDAEQADPTTEIVKGQIVQVLDILRCFQGGASVTYLEDDVIVNHFEWTFRDLP